MNALAQNFATDFSHHQPISGKQIWIGRILSGIVSAFFLLDGGMKLFKPAFVVKATVELGYPESTIVGIGIVLVLSTLLYLIPRTAIFGAVLLTGYLGGAVATNIRVSAPLFNILFPIIFAALAWLGLYLRDRRMRVILS
jgi:hypothetical protein